MRKANLKDVAALAGVSQGTASRVLNNQSVRKESKIRVEQAMKELNYTPNLLARSLKSAVSNTIGVMVADISSPIAATLISGMQHAAQEMQYDLILYNTNAKHYKEEEAIRIFVEKRVMGIIYTSNTMTPQIAGKLKQSGLPCVLVASQYEDMTCVIIDNFQAAADAVSFLCRKGHQKISMISGPLDDPNAGKPRYEGFCQTITNAGLDLAECPVVFARDYRMQEGFCQMQKMLEDGFSCSALFCASDELAIGAIKALNEYGIRVPADVSVIGLDGVEAGRYITPTLASVYQPFQDLGKTAFEVLTAKVRGESFEDNIILKHQLRIEASVIQR